MLVRRLVLAVVILVLLHELCQFLAVEFGDVLEHDTDVPRVVLPGELLLVGFVLKHDGFAEIVDRWGFEKGVPLLKGFLVVLVVCDDESQAKNSAVSTF